MARGKRTEAKTGSAEAEEAIRKLGEKFPLLRWDFRAEKFGDRTELVSYWPGEPDEDIMVCVFRGREIHERFHRQDFFFINYAYRGDFGAQSYRFDNHITVREDECYLGQPFSGYALYGASDREIVILGVLIRRELFYRRFLPAVSRDRRLVHFFLDPQEDSFSDEFLLLKGPKNSSIRSLLELMAVEYAGRRSDTQEQMALLTEALLRLLTRRLRESSPEEQEEETVPRMVRWMEGHLDRVTLTMLSAQFGYNATYVSALLSRRTGRTFSQILLQLRMERAALLLRSTDLTVEEIAPMLGYGDKSNFYRAFRDYYGMTPREFTAAAQDGRA